MTPKLTEAIRVLRDTSVPRHESEHVFYLAIADALESLAQPQPVAKEGGEASPLDMTDRAKVYRLEAELRDEKAECQRMAQLYIDQIRKTQAAEQRAEAAEALAKSERDKANEWLGKLHDAERELADVTSAAKSAQKETNRMLGETMAELEAARARVGVWERAASELHNTLRPWCDQGTLDALDKFADATEQPTPTAQTPASTIAAVSDSLPTDADDERIVDGLAARRAGEARVMGGPAPAVVETKQARAPGCKCHWEVGDSPCPVHGENEESPPGLTAEEAGEGAHEAYNFAAEQPGCFAGINHRDCLWQEQPDPTRSCRPSRSAQPAASAPATSTRGRR